MASNNGQADPSELQVVTTPTPLPPEREFPAHESMAEDETLRPLSEGQGDRILSTDEIRKVLAGESVESHPADDEQRQMMEDLFGAEHVLDPGTVRPKMPGADPAPAVAAPQTPVVDPQAQQVAVTGEQPKPTENVPVEQQLSPNEAAMQARIELLQTQISQMMTRNQTPTQVPQGLGKTPEQVSDPVPDYNLDVPDVLMEAIRGEDPLRAKQAMSALATGLAQSVHQTVRAEYEAKLAQVPQTVQSQMDTRSQQQQIYDDFYTTYPELNQPQFKAMIPVIANQAAQELGVSGWTTQLRDEIARRASPLVPTLHQRLVQQQAVGQQGALMAQPQAVPQQALGRPAAAPQYVQQPGMYPAPAATPAVPMLARDANGNLVPIVAPQLMTSGVRPVEQNSANAELQDIWATLDV